jgi:AcrR family transcriptional regulator
MRLLADELGMKPMSLYRYVADRDELETLVVDRVLGPVDLSLPARASWQRRLLLLGERVRAAVAEHPNVVPLLLVHRHRSAHSIRWGETVLGVLAEAGFDGSALAIAFRALLAYVVGALQVEYLGALSGEGTTALTQLRPESFPHLVETARHAQHIPDEEEFRRGLLLLLRGMEREQ